MITIGEMNEILDEIASELPEEIFKDLNGGVGLLDETKKSTKDPNGNLFTLGEYHRDQMGRYIVLYYGSLCAVYGNSSRERYRKHLKDVLTHELTHHWESLAGERDLEIKDEIDMDKYLSKRRRK
ncbi:MAG: metallopeptidase family protein [Oscillospiraceae bacterium]|nr:metallopeptidase family protein [Oscillospiraceae bacterium]MCL2278024.1 metallopeptidase family protein [Oscillospiraceae bacterium]